MKILFTKLVLLFAVVFALMYVSFAQSDQSDITESGSQISDRKLKILEQPLPEMIGECRKAHFQGTITLRVEFQSNSEIGKIQPLVKMPYFMNCVVEAAEKIKFEPAIKHGIATTVFRSVQYTFDWESGWRNLLNKPVHVSNVFYREIPTCSKNECKLTMEVEFQASGELGKVSVVEDSCDDIPLQQKALAEINRVEFQPALKNGEPISTTKKIDFVYKCLK